MKYRDSLARLLGALALAGCTGPPEEVAPAPQAEAPIVGKAPPATGGYPSVVMLSPEVAIETPINAVGPHPHGSRSGTRSARPALGLKTPTVQEPALMDQYGTAFWPKLLVVRPGQPVDFKNSEDVLHNVHVVHAETRETEFNVGTPMVGAYRHVFTREGAYDVSCNIHPSMAAFVVVTAAPFVAVADSEGNFTLEAIPAGSYDVRVWNLDPKRRVESRIAIDAMTRILTLTPS